MYVPEFQIHNDNSIDESIDHKNKKNKNALDRQKC